MACFLVPTAEAIVTGVVSKVEKKNEVVVEGKIPFSRKLKWLKNMLWGGAALLAYGARETGDFLLVSSTHLERHYGGDRIKHSQTPPTMREKP